MNKTTHILTLLALALISQVSYAQMKTFSLDAKAFKIPHFKGNVSSKNFTAMGFDGKSKNITLSNGNSWCEIPFRNGTPTIKGAFIAPTKGYKILAIARTPNNVYIFDGISNTIMGSKQRFKLPIKISPTGMAFHKQQLYIADNKHKKLYCFRLEKNKAILIQSTKLRRSVLGLSSDGNALYSCNETTIFRYDAKIHVTATYKLTVKICNIAFTPTKNIVALSKNGSYLYIFSR